jgi:hypothetical protein
LFRAFFDESGCHDGARSFVLAGFLGKARKWAELDKLWRRCLVEFEVGDFHATDLFGRRRDFAGWTEARVEDFCRSLVDLVQAHELIPVAGVAPVEEFLNRDEAERKILTGGRKKGSRKWIRSGMPSTPYLMIFPFLFVQVVKVLLDEPRKVKAHFVFDSHERYRHLALEFFGELKDTAGVFGHRLGSIAYVDRRENSLLAFPDLLAHLIYRSASATLSGSVQEGTLDGLLDRKRSDSLRYFDRRSLETILPVLSRELPPPRP